MENRSRERTPPTSARDYLRYPRYPLHNIIAAVAPDETEGVVNALVVVGFAGDKVDIITAEDVLRLDEPVGGSGLRGLLTRLSLSMGDNLDEIEQARRELKFGHVLVLLPVHGDAERDRAHAILREHRGHAMHYFGLWTITTLEGDAE